TQAGVTLVIAIALQPWHTQHARRTYLRGRFRLSRNWRRGFHSQQLVDGCRAFGERLAEGATMTIARLDDVLETDRLAGQFGADRAAEECVGMEDADLGQIAWVIADDHLLADVSCQCQVEIPEALKMHAVALDSSRARHGEQQQVQLLERVGKPR